MIDKLITASSKQELIIEIQELCKQWDIGIDDLFYREQRGYSWRKFDED